MSEQGIDIEKPSPTGTGLLKGAFRSIGADARSCQLSPSTGPVSSDECHLALPEKCFKAIISRLDFIDRLLLECVNHSWRQSITYDDIKCFRLLDLSSWSNENALSRWHYRSAPSTDPLRSIDREWSTLDERTINQILSCVLSRCKNMAGLSFSFNGDADGESKVVITSEIVRLLKTHSSQIQSLDLSQCAITDEALLKLLKKNKRNLLELNLNECILVPTGLLSTCHLERALDDALCKMRRLRRLNPSAHEFDAFRLPETGLQAFTALELTNKTLLADEQLARLWCEGDRPSAYQLESLVLSDNNSMQRFDIVAHLQTLRRLTLQRLPRLNDEDLQQIFHWCQRLTNVELVDCRRIRFRFRWPSSLKWLRVIDPCQFDSQNLVCLGAQCLKLRHFELKMKNLHTNGPDANAYLAFAKVCSKLRSVSIDVIAVPNSIIFYFATYCKKLMKFSCNQMAMGQMLERGSEPADVVDRKSLKLRSLQLWCMKLNFHYFMELIDHCHYLKSLNFRRVSFDCESNDAFSALLALLAKRCVSLKNLSLADCPDLSPRSIEYFYENRQHQLCSDGATSIKHMQFSYRNSFSKLMDHEKEFIIRMKTVGVDFDQECGVHYSQHEETSFGSSLDMPAFC